MYCQLYDLPAGDNKKGRLRDPRYTLLSVPHFVNRGTARNRNFHSLIHDFVEPLEPANKKANGSGYPEPLAVFTKTVTGSPRGRRTGRGLELKFQPPLDYAWLAELEQSAAHTDPI